MVDVGVDPAFSTPNPFPSAPMQICSGRVERNHADQVPYGAYLKAVYLGTVCRVILQKGCGTPKMKSASHR
jgi:hypothetical protein